MQEALTRLLRAHPFVPFLIMTRDGQSQAVSNVERLSAGRDLCAYVDQQGYISLIPYTAIDRVATKNGPELI
jgi:hypothetical protein